jgi:filamentous hemagglutinin family protein
MYCTEFYIGVDMKQGWRSLLLTLPLSIIGSLTFLHTVKAQQVTSDGTVSTTVTTPDGKNFNINDGTRRGGNLFHSFKEFSVPTSGSANFNNAVDVRNIISRVTGGSVSSIDGSIKALGNANLFLLNPAGIIFGPNASLNIGGSFFATTANSFVFENGLEFSATDPQAPPLLTINIPNIPIGMRYRDNPGNITTQSTSLAVPQGNSLALVGGNVNLSGGILYAPGGRVELGGLSAPGTVGLNSDGSLSFPVGVQRGDVSLTNRAQVNVFAGGGGNIAVNARNLELSGGSILGAGIQSGLGTPGAQAGDIKIDATERVKIEGRTGSPSGIFNITGNFSSDISNITEPGNAGNIIINTGTLEGIGNILISSSTNGEGNAGRVIITAEDKVSLTGDDSANNFTGFAFLSSFVGESGTGNGADIIINTPSLSLSNTGILASSLGQGNAGNIELKASEYISVGSRSQLQAATSGRGNAGNIIIDALNAAVSFDGANTLASTAVGEASTGKGGDITVKAHNLSVTNGASLFTDTFGRAEAGRLANAGNIQINVSEDVSFKGASDLSSSTSGQGNAGNVAISAGGKISFDGKGSEGSISGIFSDVTTGAEGNGGNIELRAGSVSVTNGAQLSASTSGKGDAGSVRINATDTISFSGTDNNGFPSAAFSTVESGGVGNGGEINITAGSLELTNGGQLNTFVREASITTAGGNGNAGNVKLDIRNGVTITGVSNNGARSGIFSNVQSSAVGNAGSIDINARSLSVTNNGRISSSNFSNGAAGNIKITTTKDIRLDNQASIDANTNGGEGNITLNSRDLILRRNSSITTNATGKATGGNITINTGNLVAFPKEDSDITAKSDESFGGRISINTKGGIFGIQFRQQDTPLSDITASSALGPQFSGTVQINTPDIDPSSGLFDLPETVTDPAQQIAQNPCLRGGGEFIITGRGGFPTNPSQILSSDNVRVDLVKPVASTRNSTSATQKQTSTRAKVEEIVPARGWIFNEKGQVVLVSYDPTKTGVQREQPTPASSCAAQR